GPKKPGGRSQGSSPQGPGGPNHSGPGPPHGPSGGKPSSNGGTPPPARGGRPGRLPNLGGPHLLPPARPNNPRGPEGPLNNRMGMLVTPCGIVKCKLKDPDIHMHRGTNGYGHTMSRMKIRIHPGKRSSPLFLLILQNLHVSVGSVHADILAVLQN